MPTSQRTIAAQPGPAPAIELVEDFCTFAGRYDLILCDVWGVLHDGVTAFPEAGAALARFRAGGGRVVLVSNAPRAGHLVERQLAQLGVDREAYDRIVTSGDVTRSVIAGKGTAPVYYIGPERDLEIFEGLGARIVPLDEAEYVVCTGLIADDGTDSVADYAPLLRDIRARDLWMVCANPDIVVERGHQLLACAGALAAAYDELGGASFTGGKPHRPIYEAAVATAAELLGHPPQAGRILAVGDAIRTDVAGACDFGIDALLVARGIHAPQLGSAGRIDPGAALPWLAEQPFRPTALIWALS